MGQLIEGVDRQQAVLLPEYLNDCGDVEAPVQAIDAFVEILRLSDFSFQRRLLQRVAQAITRG